MSTATGDSATLPQATPDQIDALAKSALGAGDAGFAQATHHLMLIHQARVSQAKRTAATLKKQSGADSAATKAAEAAVKSSTARVAIIGTANLQATTPSPQVSATGWALHGRVFTAQLHPVGNLTVFLVDDRKKYQEQFGFAYTDSTGYFLINYAGTTDKIENDTRIFVEITNNKKQPIYLSTTQFQPTAGSATYQNITLPTGEKPLGYPPDQIRSVAIPDSGRKA
jgi:hypothetical protein